jgi:hypothetical protein
MSVINMFRKEALRHQYKSQEFGHSVIKQPEIINKAIILLCVILLVIFISVQFITLTTNQSYQLNSSAENYQPLVMSQAIVINEQLINSGSLVNKNQPLVNITVIDTLINNDDDEQRNKHQYLTASKAGYYFHSSLNTTITPAYQPIGYLLKNNVENDYIFWLTERPKKEVGAGDLVEIKFNQKTLKGKVSMVFGEYIKNKGVKISIKLNDGQYLSLLSPQSTPKLLLKKQPKSIMQLLK